MNSIILKDINYIKLMKAFGLINEHRSNIDLKTFVKDIIISLTLLSL